MTVSPLPTHPSGVYPKLAALATCLCAQIVADDLPDVCFCGLVPGDLVMFDYVTGCDDVCGMAWVRLTATQPTSGIGVVNETVNNCASELGFTVEMGIIRCLPTADDGGPPTPAEYLAATQQQVADMLCMRRAFVCCDIGDFILDSYTPVGPEGQAVGGYWSATLGET